MMAVEARHLILFPSQLAGNREMMAAIGDNLNGYNNTPIGYGLPPLSGTTADTLLPMYNSAITDSLPAKKDDSGLTYAVPVSRKRPRDSINPLICFPNGQIPNPNPNDGRCGSFTFLGEDVSLQIHQQQSEIDRFISQHTEKVRLEIDERRKRYSRRIVAAVEDGMMKRLRAKEEEIEKIGKLNWALEERVKAMFVENQIWRDLAQTNEATANALRCNLEQVLSQVKDNSHHRGGDADLIDDVQSCCGSNSDGVEEEERRTLAGFGAEITAAKDKSSLDNNINGSGSGISDNRLCRHCRKEESCVLLLPCRHLCLCTVCGSSVHSCPICNAAKNASVHVLFS